MKKRLKIIIPVALVLVLVIAASVVLLPYCFFSGKLNVRQELYLSQGSMEGDLCYRFNPITGVLVVYGQGEITGYWDLWTGGDLLPYYMDWRTYANDIWCRTRVQTVIVLSQSASHEYLDISRTGFPNLDTVYYADSVQVLNDSAFLYDTGRSDTTVTIYFAGDAPSGLEPEDRDYQSCHVVYRSDAQGFDAPAWAAYEHATAGSVPPWWWFLLG